MVMGNRNRAASRNLFAEFWDHASRTAKHVAEANHDKARTTAWLERLTNHFGEPLAGSHNVNRVHRLVGRNAHKALHASANRFRREYIGTVYIVAYRLPGILIFHERHMLIGRGMEYHVRLIFRQHLMHAIPVLNVADDAYDGQCR